MYSKPCWLRGYSIYLLLLFHFCAVCHTLKWIWYTNSVVLVKKADLVYEIVQNMAKKQSKFSKLHNSNKNINLYRTNVTASVTQPCTRCWPDVTAAVTPRMHEVSKLSPCLLETETQTNCTVVPTTGLAFVRSYYVIYGSLGFDIIYVCTWPLGSAEGVTDTIQ
jgi:hypothetical protein